MTDPSLSRIDRTLRTALVAALVLTALYAFRGILPLVFAALLLGCVLSGAARSLNRVLRIGHLPCVLAIVAVFVFGIGALLWWRGPEMADHAVLVTRSITEQIGRAWPRLQNTRWGAWAAQRAARTVLSVESDLGAFVAGFASSTLGVVSSLVVLVATGLALAAAPQVYVRGALRLLPPAWRPRGSAVLHGIGHSLQFWFLGQLLDMAVVTVLTAIALFALGLPLPLTLAAFAGLMNFVPYIGALAGSVPAILVGLAQSPSLAVWTAVAFVVIQGIEGNVIAPLIQKRTVSLPPALTILSQTLLGTGFGLLGIVLATPAMAATMTAVRMIYVESFLERPPR